MLMPMPSTFSRLLVAGCCLAPLTAAASAYSDEDLKQLLTIVPVSEVNIMEPGGLHARYTDDDQAVSITVLNREEQISFIVQFTGAALARLRLEDLNEWNANSRYPAYRVDADQVKLDAVLLVIQPEIGAVMPSTSYLSLTYLHFAKEALTFQRYLNQRLASVEAEPTSVPTSQTAAVSEAASGWTFPEINQDFSRRSEIQREPWVASLQGEPLSGWGTITEVGRCGFFDSSKRYGSQCLKITLDNDTPRAVLYYPTSREAELAELEVGRAHEFSDCEIVDLQDLGFWTTVTCDMR